MKEFVPYELALELKELGFDEPNYFLKWYDSKGKIREGLGLGEVKAPLYQQAFRWFREKKLSDSYIYRYQDRTDGSINFGYSIIHDYGIEEVRFIKENYTSYEEAELACLKKLIEIVKNK